MSAQPKLPNAQALPSFQAYQQAFTAYVRDPKQKMPKAITPKGVSARRMKVYAEIVFNNLFESVSACYPVSSKVLGKRAWQKLVRDFFRDYQSETPIFREIPEQFLHYLNTRHDMPPYLSSLAHYEWVELAVSTMQVPDLAEINPQGDLLQNIPVLNPALALLSYNYPVQLISPRIKPTEPLANPVHLLVYRDIAFQVQFIETNPITARLLARLQTSEFAGQTALALIATELQHPEPQVIINFGAQILQDLQAQGVILGTKQT